MNIEFPRELVTYYTDTLAENGVGRKCVENVRDAFEGFHDPSILSSEFAEGTCSLLKKGGNGLQRVTHFELLGERMVD